MVGNSGYLETWELNNPSLKIQWVKKEFTREIRKYIEINENENTTCKTVWGATKAVSKRNL